MAASCFFYAAWDWRYLGLLLFISVIDYVAASKIAESSIQRTRRAWLILSVVSNLGVLAYFKYCNFFIDNLNLLLGRAGERTGTVQSAACRTGGWTRPCMGV
jgi:alginate O-acetyltransferase complex protein AlgI